MASPHGRVQLTRPLVRPDQPSRDGVGAAFEPRPRRPVGVGNRGSRQNLL